MSWSPSVAIIGAGIGGIGAAIQLKKQLGLSNITLFDKDVEVGGTWSANSYPGCACDIPSHMYSFSFEKNPDWSHQFPSRDEILAYIKRVVEKYGIRNNIKLGHEVTEIKWSEQLKEYSLTVRQISTGKTLQVKANIVIFGTGILRIPSVPNDLVAKYDGQWNHTARWKQDFEYTDKNVAIIGTGTSAAQVIPAIAPHVKTLYVYQRTPHWVLPRDDFEFSSRVKSMFRWVPFFMFFYRLLVYLLFDFLWFGFQSNGGMLSTIAGGFLSWRAHSGLKRIPSETLRKALTPKFDLGCKRIIFSDDIYPALCRPNVHLITSPISSIEGRTITNVDGTQTKVDALILATGFVTSGYVSPIKVIGRGVELEEYWNGVPKGYYGICTHKFPNAFFLLGPNSSLGHHSVLFMEECQINYIINLIQQMRERKATVAEVTEQAQNDFNTRISKDMKGMVWTTGGCKSWYQTKTGQIFSNWTKNTTTYWWETRKANPDHFSFN